MASAVDRLEARRAYMREYERAYRQRPEAKALKAERQRAYRQRPAVKERQAALQLERRGRESSEARGRRTLLDRASTFGLTVTQLATMLSRGTCDVCGTTDPGGRGDFHVDHDHACCPGRRTCGRCVRGLLCHACNTGSGKVDDPEWLLLRHAYLVDPPGWAGRSPASSLNIPPG